MTRKNLINLFYKRAVSEKYKLVTGNSQLDKGFCVAKGFLNLLVCEPYSGGTAIALEFASKYVDEMDVIYFDPNQSVLKNRTKGLNLGNLTVCYPNTGSEIMTLVTELVKVSEIPRFYIIDNVKNLRDGWDLKSDLGVFCSNLRTIDPNCTILAIQRASTARSNAWTNIGFISILEKRYVNSDLIGHVVKIKSEVGEGYSYINYTDGRLSPGYDIAIEMTLAGKVKGTYFEYGNIKERSFWGFVDKYDKL